ncbi:MAG: membrane protein [Methyloligella sp.]|nr:MAG: membrane protein [Methyloligella sp.]
MSYFILKYLHILGACVLFGTGMGIAFFMFFAVRSKSVEVIASVAPLVVLADYMFTLTAVLVQPITGALLVHGVGYSFFDHWVLLSIALYIFIGICWIPVVFMQIEMKNIVLQASAMGTALPQRFHTLYKRWFILGWPAFLSIMIIFALMIEKPVALF